MIRQGTTETQAKKQRMTLWTPCWTPTRTASSRMPRPNRLFLLLSTQPRATSRLIKKSWKTSRTCSMRKVSSNLHLGSVKSICNMKSTITLSLTTESTTTSAKKRRTRTRKKTRKMILPPLTVKETKRTKSRKRRSRPNCKCWTI